MTYSTVFGHGGVEQVYCPPGPVRGSARESSGRGLRVRGALIGAHGNPVQRPGWFGRAEERPRDRVPARAVAVRGHHVVARHGPPGHRLHDVVRRARGEKLPARRERPRRVRRGRGGHHGDGGGGPGHSGVEHGFRSGSARQHEPRRARAERTGPFHSAARPQHHRAVLEPLTRGRDVPRALSVLELEVDDAFRDRHRGRDGPRGALGTPEVRDPGQPHERETPHPDVRGGEAHGLIGPRFLHDAVRVRREQRCATRGQLAGDEPRVRSGGRGGFGVQHGDPGIAELAPHAASPQLLGETAREQVRIQMHGHRGPRVPRAHGPLRETELAHLAGPGPRLGQCLADPARVRREELPVPCRGRIPPPSGGAGDVRGQGEVIAVEPVRSHELRRAPLGAMTQHLHVPGPVQAGHVAVAVRQRGEVVRLHVGHTGGIAPQAPPGAGPFRAGPPGSRLLRTGPRGVREHDTP